MSQPDTTIEDIKEILNEICWREMLTMTEYEQAAQQLESYINNKVKEARIDELEMLLNDSEWLEVRYDPNDPTSVDHSEQAIIADTVSDRISQLKKELK